MSLSPLTVFIGNNGAGKSTFFQALDFLSDLISTDSINSVLERSNTSFQDLVTLRASDRTIKFLARVQLPANGWRPEVDAAFTIAVKKRRSCYVDYEEVLPWDKRGSSVTETDAEVVPYMLKRFTRLMVAKEHREHKSDPDYLAFHNAVLAHSLLGDVYEQSSGVGAKGMGSLPFSVRAAGPQRFPVLSSIAHVLATFSHYEIWGPEKLREPSRFLIPTISLQADGRELAAALYLLRRRSKPAFDSLVTDLKGAYPWLSDIEFRSVPGAEVSLSFVERSDLTRGRSRKHPAKKYNVMQVSDGFLRMLALSTIRYTCSPGSILAYEEPENGLHPSMIRRSAQQLRAIAESGVQVLISTHSPQLVSEILAECTAESVCDQLRLVRRSKSGTTKISRPDVDVVRDALEQGLTVGDLWYLLLGEDEFASSEGPEA